MNETVLVELPGSVSLGRRLATRLGVERLELEHRRFPDEEWYLRLTGACADRDVVLAAGLVRCDAKLLPLLFAADLLRELGARRLTLVAPYLPYMRQDARFQAGEAVTSRSFAKLLSATVDMLVTLDPHLHRYRHLEDIYAIPTQTLHAAPLLAEWIKSAVTAPLLVGPDAESEQWVAEVARLAAAPYVVLDKVRHGDSDVAVTVPDVRRWRGHSPVLVDDIISTARTMIEAVRELVHRGLPPPVCVGVHAVFSGDAYAALRLAGAARIVTTNAIEHESNAIDTTELLAKALEEPREA